MNLRIAKKVLKNYLTGCRYSPEQVKAAHRRAKVPMPSGVDLASGQDFTGFVVADVETGRIKTSFHHRTGTAPSHLPDALVPGGSDHDNMETKSLTELKALAKEKGLSGYSTLKKAELIALLTKG